MVVASLHHEASGDRAIQRWIITVIDELSDGRIQRQGQGRSDRLEGRGSERECDPFCHSLFFLFHFSIPGSGVHTPRKEGNEIPMTMLIMNMIHL